MSDYEHLLLKRCAKCGTHNTERYCVNCKPEINRERHQKYDQAKRKVESKQFYNSKLWKTLSLKQRTEFPYCQYIQADGTMCRSMNKIQADHIIPREKGGPDRQDNLQTLCQSHHSMKTGQETGMFRGLPIITIVCGPPGSGKTSYVLARAQPTDIILDLDRIVKAVSTTTQHTQPMHIMRCVWEMRDALINHLATTRDVPRAWIIEGAPTPERRNALRDKLKAQVIVLMPTAAQCKARIKKDKERDRLTDWNAHIKQWFASYTPSSLDIVIE